MKTVEFKGTVAPDGQIAIPAEIACQVPAGEPVQVILLWGAFEEDQLWRSAGRPPFEAAYAAEDSVYEQLIDEPFTR